MKAANTLALEALKDCPVCSNAYLAIRTDLYKDGREFVYCDCCGCLADRRVWNRISALEAEAVQEARILTCVYCGHEYPQDTPTHGDGVLTEHIKICEKHPMRKAESDIVMLRAALVGLIGADSQEELQQMEITMRLLPAPDADKAVSINAIHALLSVAAPPTGRGCAGAGRLSAQTP